MYLEIIRLNITIHVMPTHTTHNIHKFTDEMIIQSKWDKQLANNYSCPIFGVDVFIVVIVIRQSYALNGGANAAPAT